MLSKIYDEQLYGVECAGDWDISLPIEENGKKVLSCFSGCSQKSFHKEDQLQRYAHSLAFTKFCSNEGWEARFGLCGRISVVLKLFK